MNPTTNNGLARSTAPGEGSHVDPSSGRLTPIPELVGDGEKDPSSYKLSEAGKQLVESIVSVIPAAKATLETLTEKCPTCLDAKDGRGNSVLANIERVALSDKQLAVSMIDRVYHPGNGTQEKHGTCGAESLLKCMNVWNVGEWSRIVADLAVDNRTELKGTSRGPVPLEVPFEARKEDKPADPRDLLDRKVQSALMQFAAPSNAPYSVSQDAFIDVTTGVKTQGGYSKGHARKVIEAFTGQEHREFTGQLGRAGELIPNILKEVKTPGKFMYVALNWPCPSEPFGMHAVAVGSFADELKAVGRSVESGRVYFVNPHGMTVESVAAPSGAHTPPPLADGANLKNPPRRIEHNGLGIQSMTVSDFEKHLEYAFVAEGTALARRVAYVENLDGKFGQVIDQIVGKESKAKIDSFLNESQLRQELKDAMRELSKESPSEYMTRALFAPPYPTPRESLIALRDLYRSMIDAEPNSQQRMTNFVNYFVSSTAGQVHVEKFILKTLHAFVGSVEDEKLQMLNKHADTLRASEQQPFKQFIVARIRSSVEESFKEALRKELISMTKNAPRDSLFSVDVTQPGWSQKVSLQRILEMAQGDGASQRDKTPVANNGYPQRLGDGFSDSRVAAIKTAVNIGVSGLAFSGALEWAGAQIPYPFATYWFSSACMGANLLLNGVLSSLRRFDGQDFKEKTKYLGRTPAEIAKMPVKPVAPTSQELMSSLAVMFDVHLKETGPVVPNSRDDIYLKTLYGAMRELYDFSLSAPKNADVSNLTSSIVRKVNQAHDELGPRGREGFFRGWVVDSAPWYMMPLNIARQFFL